MKVITGEPSGLVKYVFEDSKPVVIEEARIIVGNPSSPDFYIVDLNSSNSKLHTNITNLPDEWNTDKHRFNGQAWELNPDWVEPEELEDE